MTPHDNPQLPPPVDFSRYPPSPIVWAYTTVDTVCEPLGCTDSWRNVLPSSFTSNGAWLDPEFQVPVSVFTILPSFTTYDEFLQQQEIQSQKQPTTLQSLKQYAFSTPSTSLANLTSFPSIVIQND